MFSRLYDLSFLGIFISGRSSFSFNDYLEIGGSFTFLFGAFWSLYMDLS